MSPLKCGKTANICFSLYPVTEVSRSGNGVFKCGCLPFLRKLRAGSPPHRLQVTPHCCSVFSWGSFPAMPASTENLIWGQLLKNSYLLTQSIKLFHHFCNFKSQLHADVTRWCVQIQMCCMLFLSCWWFDGTAQYERERSSTLAYVHGSYCRKVTLRHHQQSCFHCWLLFEMEISISLKTSVSFSQLSPPPQCHVAPAQLLITGVDGGWEHF